MIPLKDKLLIYVRKKPNEINLSSVRSCCRETGSFRRAADIKIFGLSLVQDPPTIDFIDVPEIQYRALELNQLHTVKHSFC